MLKADQIRTARTAPRESRTLWLCVLSQLTALLFLTPIYWRAQLDVDWSGTGGLLVLLAMLYGVAVYLSWERDRFAPMVLATAALCSASLVLSPAQYLAASTGAPLIDPWLAAADRRLGIHVPDLARWTWQHPLFARVLVLAYQSLILQIAATAVLLPFFRRMDRLVEFVLLYHITATLTVICLAIWPAACVFQYYGFPSVLDQRRFIEHFNGVRSGEMTVVALSNLEGLISMPSFHVAAALLVTWAFRGLPPFPWLIGLNALMIVSTVLTGAHYVIDLVVTIPFTMACVGALRLTRRWLSRRDSRE